MWGKIIIGDSRTMREIENESVDLVVTSPPYWHIKDYGTPGQIGYGQTLHEYLVDLCCVWAECHRLLRQGARLCINIGDQFARSVVYGRYKIIPIHAEVIAQCERIGFDFMGSIIWQKKTTLNTTGGASVMGSYPYPPNGIVEIDYEFIHILKKPGRSKKVSKETKQASKLSKEEWKQFFSGHWHFGGARQIGHEAMFPDELPRRLIKMFTFVGDTVVDPFLGSGTTAKVALGLERNVIGYEINGTFLQGIRRKMDPRKGSDGTCADIEIIEAGRAEKPPPVLGYVPIVRDAKLQIDPRSFKPKAARHYKVVGIVDENTIRLDTGRVVRFLGVRSKRKSDALRYLDKYLLGKTVSLKFSGSGTAENREAGASPDRPVAAYVHLKNRIFVNAYLIKSGLASPDLSEDHKLKAKFLGLSGQP